MEHFEKKFEKCDWIGKFLYWIDHRDIEKFSYVTRSMRSLIFQFLLFL